MLRFFLENNFAKGYGLSRGKIPVLSERFTENFSLRDEKACNRCDMKSACNSQVLKVGISEPVIVINLEEFSKNLTGTKAEFKGGVCDYIMYSSGISQVVLCELSCSSSLYVNPNQGLYPEGKRAKALAQLKNSLEKIIYADEILEILLLSHTNKRLVFAWRESDIEPSDFAEESMMDFSATPDSLEDVLYSVEHGFEFLQIKYPAVFQWES